MSANTVLFMNLSIVYCACMGPVTIVECTACVSVDYDNGCRSRWFRTDILCWLYTCMLELHAVLQPNLVNKPDIDLDRTAAPYLACDLCRIADIQPRWRLRSTSTSALDVPVTRRGLVPSVITPLTPSLLAHGCQWMSYGQSAAWRHLSDIITHAVIAVMQWSLVGEDRAY